MDTDPHLPPRPKPTERDSAHWKGRTTPVGPVRTGTVVYIMPGPGMGRIREDVTNYHFQFLRVLNQGNFDTFKSGDHVSFLVNAYDSALEASIIAP